VSGTCLHSCIQCDVAQQQSVQMPLAGRICRTLAPISHYMAQAVQASRTVKSHACKAFNLCPVQVSESGDVLYVLPSNFRQVIAGKSWLLRAEPFLQKVRDASAYLVRVTFGTALITSVVLVWVTIVAILSSSGKDDDRRLVRKHALYSCSWERARHMDLHVSACCPSCIKNQFCKLHA